MAKLVEELLTLADHVWELMRPNVRRTPLIHSETLSQRFGVSVYLKLENLQVTNSFKYRPAMASLMLNLDHAREKGVVTSSSGNFAGAVAGASRKLGVAAKIVMRPSAAGFKVDRVRQFGGEVVRCADDYLAREEMVATLVEQEGLLRLHPHDSAETIAGDCMVAREILEDLPDVGTVLVPTSGAGLLGGTALFMAPRGVDVWGVQPEANGTLLRSMEAGEPIYREGIQTVADGLTAARPGKLGFELVQEFVRGAKTVSESSLVAGVKDLATSEGILAEAASAAGVAALTEGFRPQSDRPCVLVLTGGNIDPQQWANWLS